MSQLLLLDWFGAAWFGQEHKQRSCEVLLSCCCVPYLLSGLFGWIIYHGLGWWWLCSADSTSKSMPFFLVCNPINLVITLRASLGFCHLSLAFCILSSLLADGSTFVLVAIFSVKLILLALRIFIRIFRDRIPQLWRQWISGAFSGLGVEYPCKNLSAIHHYPFVSSWSPPPPRHTTCMNKRTRTREQVNNNVRPSPRKTLQPRSSLPVFFVFRLTAKLQPTTTISETRNSSSSSSSGSSNSSSAHHTKGGQPERSGWQLVRCGLRK